MNSIYTIPEIYHLMSPVLKKYQVQKAILFGSYGRGTATDFSDIDLLIHSNLRGLKFIGLLDELKEVTGKEIDLFNQNHIIQGSPIDLEIKKTGVVFYES